jgi:hypothetical protein
VVRVRLSGAAEVIETSGGYLNRREPGERPYLTVRVRPRTEAGQ